MSLIAFEGILKDLIYLTAQTQIQFTSNLKNIYMYILTVFAFYSNDFLRIFDNHFVVLKYQYFQLNYESKHTFIL